MQLTFIVGVSWVLRHGWSLRLKVLLELLKSFSPLNAQVDSSLLFKFDIIEHKVYSYPHPSMEQLMQLLWKGFLSAAITCSRG